ncbi:hypothetical protein KM043_003775 [Ampulex compressa]|nr:hypothetical protein KM043_003775 [Ampulex compressa]
MSNCREGTWFGGQSVRHVRENVALPEDTSRAASGTMEERSIENARDKFGKRTSGSSTYGTRHAPGRRDERSPRKRARFRPTKPLTCRSEFSKTAGHGKAAVVGVLLRESCFTHGGIAPRYNT